MTGAVVIEDSKGRAIAEIAGRGRDSARHGSAWPRNRFGAASSHPVKLTWGARV